MYVLAQENRRFGIITLGGAIAFFLAIAPILDPYILAELGTGFTLKINDVLLLFFGMICFCKSLKFNRNTGFLCYWILGLAVISIFGNLVSSTSAGSSFKNIFVWLLYAFFLSYIWKSPCRERFYNWVEKIALLAAVIVLVQLIAGYLGIPMWDGKLPFLELSKYDGWAGYIDKNTGDIRPNGVFQEASYVGIYLSVAYAQAFKKEKLRNIIIYATAMLATTSMVSIIVCGIVTVYFLIARKKIDLSSRMTRRIMFIVVIAIASIIMLSSRNQAISDSLFYVIKRFNNIGTDLNGLRMSSTKYRILGHISLFGQYSFLQKIFGVGVAQYSQLFGVSAYSNVWVTTILNSGVLGLVFLIASVIALARNMERKNMIFLAILILVLSSDYQWFNWYFFYLIAACILENQCSRTDLVEKMN